MSVKSVIKRWIPGWRSAAWDLPSWRALSHIPFDNEPCEPRGLASVYAAVTLLSGLMASLPHRIVRDADAGGIEIVTGSDAAHALAELDFTEREALYMDLLLGGNGFILKHFKNGRLHRLEVLDARKVILAVDDNGRTWYDIMPDAFLRRDQMTINADRMIHFKYRTGGGYGAHNLLGVSPLVACSESMAMVGHIAHGTTHFYKNVSLPSGFLSSENNLKADQMEILRAAWASHSVGDNAGKVPILGGNLKWSDAGGSRSAIDNALAEISRVSVLEVARAFGIPSQLLNETSSLNYSTSVELHRSFASMTLQPMARRLSDTFTHALITRERRIQGFRSDIDASALLVGSGADKAKYYGDLITSGIMSVDEARHRFNLPPAPEQETQETV